YHHNVALAGMILFGKKGAAQSGRNAERRKQAGGNLRANNPLRLASARKVEWPSPESCDLFEDLVLLLPVNKIAGRNWERIEPCLELRVTPPDQHQLIGIIVW